MRKLVFVGVAGMLIIFGLMCANYVKPSTLAHHESWASESGAPPPSDAITFGAILSASVGSAVLGSGLSRRGERG